MEAILTKDTLQTTARKILSKVESASCGTATLIALSGDLGAGKTTLVQAIAKELDITESVISPTFVIMKSYPVKIKNYKIKNLIHIDAYRLNHSNELLKLGWQELFENPDNLIIIEWPEQVPECIPEHGICRIELSHKDEETRGIKIML